MMFSAEYLLGREIIDDIGRFRSGALPYSSLRRKLDLCAGACGRVGAEWMASYGAACAQLKRAAEAMSPAEPLPDALELHLQRVEALLQGLSHDR